VGHGRPGAPGAAVLCSVVDPEPLQGMRACGLAAWDTHVAYRAVRTGAAPEQGPAPPPGPTGAAPAGAGPASLLDAAVGAVVAGLSPSTACAAALLALSLPPDAGALLRGATDLIARRLPSVLAEEPAGLVSLPFPAFMAVVRSPFLPPPEISVFRAVAAWGCGSADPAAQLRFSRPAAEITSLLEYVRFPQMEVPELLGIARSRLARSFVPLQDLLLEALHSLLVATGDSGRLAIESALAPGAAPPGGPCAACGGGAGRAGARPAGGGGAGGEWERGGGERGGGGGAGTGGAAGPARDGSPGPTRGAAAGGPARGAKTAGSSPAKPEGLEAGARGCSRLFGALTRAIEDAEDARASGSGSQAGDPAPARARRSLEGLLSSVGSAGASDSGDGGREGRPARASFDSADSPWASAARLRAGAAGALDPEDPSLLRLTRRVHPGVTELSFIHDGDQNGVLWHLGTGGGRAAWTNPCTTGRVRVMASSPQTRLTDYRALVSRNFVRFLCAGPKFMPSGRMETWWALDLGPGTRLACNHYTVRADESEAFPRSWSLQGSADGERWATLREHRGDRSLCLKGQYASFPVTSVESRTPVRYFRLLMTGPHACPGQEPEAHLHVGGIELYGHLSVE